LINPRLQSGDRGTNPPRRPAGTVFVPSLRDGEGRGASIPRLKSGVNQMMSHAGQVLRNRFRTGCSSQAHCIPTIIGVGTLSTHYHPTHHFSTVDTLLESKILKELPIDSVILIKGSHGIKLDKLKGKI